MEEFSRGKNVWARWSYRRVTSRSDYLLRYATRMPGQHWCFAGPALQSEGLNFPPWYSLQRHTIARYSSSYLYFLEIDTKLWVQKKKKKKDRERERGKITNRDIETALVLFVVEKKRFRTQYSHTNWLQQFAFLRVQIKFESLHHLFVYEINVSPMSWNVKYCWLVDSFQGRYTKGSRFTRCLTPRCHWQFLFHRERWSRRATVVGQDVEQVASNCLPGSGQVSSGWIEEGIEDHAGYRYLRIRIVTSLRATGSLPPKRATLDMNQFRLAFN